MTKNSHPNITSARQLLAKNLNEVLPEDQRNRDDLIDQIEPIIRSLLDHDMEKLLQVVYRVDVNEHQFKRTLAEAKPENLAKTIAEIIVDRTLQKIELRKTYDS